MFLGKDLLFIELQKTGGSHILRLLEALLPGEIKGKHNRLQDEHVGRFTIGSIRNPWDWYVSLWAYGVSGRGAIRQKTTEPFSLYYYHQMLPEYMGKNWLSPVQFLRSLPHDLLKPRNVWKQTYTDPDNPELFRTWLSMLLSDKRKYDFGEGFALSPISHSAGLMTYRYLRLFTKGADIYSESKLRTTGGIREYDERFNIINAMIRMENLEDDFIEALKKSGFSFSDEQVNRIQSAKKTNTSKRKGVGYYYDQDTLALVGQREKFIIDKYHYSPPELI